MDVELLIAFVSFLVPSKTAKIESLDLSLGGISELGLESLAASICSMPCLRSVRVHVRSYSSDQGALKATLMKDAHENESSPPLPLPLSSSSSSRVVSSTCQVNIEMDVELLIAFVSFLVPSKTAKVESLEMHQSDYRCMHDISKSASHNLGASICTMQCLKNLKLALHLSDEFYTALTKGASSLKIESLNLSVGGISELGSESLAASVCSMPCLRSVRITSYSSDRGALKATLMKDAHEDESSPPLPLPLSSSSSSSSSSLSSSRVVSSTCQINIEMDVELLTAFVSFLVPSKTAKVESLEMHLSDFRPDISKSASHNLGASICTMPCLKNLKLTLRLSDEFYTALREGASSLKVESLEMHQSDYTNMYDISKSASHNLGASICTMPCLKNVKLLMDPSDEFYTTLREGASFLKVESLEIVCRDDPYLLYSKSASESLGVSICTMPCLKNLKLAKLSDEFYTTLRKEASSLKIEQMHLMGVCLERSDSLSAFALMQNLVSLTLFDVRISDNSKHSEEGKDPSDTLSSTSLTELNVDHASFISLCGIGLLKRFPLIQKMSLAFHHGQTPFPQELLHHVTMPAVMDLTLHGYYENNYASLTSLSLVPFPNLVNLSLINIWIGKDHCKAILESLRNEKTLKTISIKDCDTDAGLDPLCNEINAEGKMTVTVQHENSRNLLYDLASVFKDIKSGSEDLQVMSQDDES